MTTQTLLQVEAALYLTIQNADDITRRKAQDNPAALVVSRVTGTNVRIIGTTIEDTYVLVAIEPHPFMVETYS